MIRAMLTASVLVLGLNAFAAGTESAPATTTTTSTTTTATETSKPQVAGEKKVAHNGAYAKAKEECLKENSSLKGKALRQCIKGKETAAK